MSDFFQTAMDFVWRPENDGQPYHNTPGDPGGATSWGVTLSAWAGWQRLHNEWKPIADFRTETQADFLPLYHTLYWNACACYALDRIGIQVFDAAVLSGPRNAAKLLQQCVDATIDGMIGPLTIEATQEADQRILAAVFCDELCEFYDTRADADRFSHGWTMRAERCRDLVISLIPKGASA